MSFSEENNRSYGNFRVILDMGMGCIYAVIGVIVLYVKSFLSVQLTPTYAIVLGGMLILYGAFRLYRGVSHFLKRKRPGQR